LYEVIERSIPIPLDGKIFYVVLFRNKHTKQFVFDIREWEKTEKLNASGYVPTNNGLHIAQKDMLTIIKVFTKLYTKWEEHF
jgi:hypothetical protein